ncbi:hypothetical protein Tco_1546618 [Tanacetum coccineum]
MGNDSLRIFPAFMKELIYKVLGLQVSLLELNRFEILLDEKEKGQVDLQEKLLEFFDYEARDMDTKLLSAPESNNTLARCWFRRNIPVTTPSGLDEHPIPSMRSSLGIITSSGWPFVSAVLSQMAHLVANITLNSARSCVMQSAFLTQGTVSRISIIFSWVGSISHEGFLSSVLLWLVIIVAVVGVTIVVIIIIAAVVVVESSYVVKLSFVIT